MPKTNADQSNSTETPNEITHPFECHRCKKRFTSPFAFGGHQNAHRKERNEEVRAICERRRRLALSRQSEVPEAVTVVPPGRIVETQPIYAAPMVQFLPMVPGVMRMDGHEKPIRFVPAPKYGPTTAGINGGDHVPYQGRREDPDEKCSKVEELDLTLRL